MQAFALHAGRFRNFHNTALCLGYAPQSAENISEVCTLRNSRLTGFGGKLRVITGCAPLLRPAARRFFLAERGLDSILPLARNCQNLRLWASFDDRLWGFGFHLHIKSISICFSRMSCSAVATTSRLMGISSRLPFNTSCMVTMSILS